MQELIAIQQNGPKELGFFGTRNMGFLHQNLIEILELCHGSDGKPSTIIHTAHTLLVSIESCATCGHDLPGGTEVLSVRGLHAQDNHIYTSGATGTNAAVIRGALRAEKPDLLTVVLPQSRSRQPPESQELLEQASSPTVTAVTVPICARSGVSVVL